jgi:hypothetical protein
MSREIAEYARNYERMLGRQISYGTGAGQLVCNQFVVAVLRGTVAPDFPMIVANDFLNSPVLRRVDTPAVGDLIHWSGHIGIVTDPDLGMFIGSQTSTGVDEASYKKGYWASSRGTITFLRYG